MSGMTHGWSAGACWLLRSGNQVIHSYYYSSTVMSGMMHGWFSGAVPHSTSLALRWMRFTCPQGGGACRDSNSPHFPTPGCMQRHHRAPWLSQLRSPCTFPHLPPHFFHTWLYAKTPPSAMAVPSAFCMLTGLAKKRTAATITTTRLTPAQSGRGGG